MHINKKVIIGSAQSYIGLVANASHWRGVLTDTKTSRDDMSPKYDSEEMAIQWCFKKWNVNRGQGDPYYNTILMLGATQGDFCAL